MGFDRFLGSVLANPAAQGMAGGVAGGALTSLLMNSKAARKLGKNALALGGAAALAGAGYWAYRKWQEGQAAKAPGAAPSTGPAATPAALPAPALPSAQASLPPVPAGTPFLPPSGDLGGRDRLARKLILAMLAAAHADGHCETAELAKILDTLEAAALNPAEKAELTAALNRPPAVEELGALAACPEEAAEIYVAALTVIDAPSPAESLFLLRLARTLKLDPALIEQLHAAAR